MAELRIRKFVDATVRADRKIAPDRRRRLEADTLYFTTSRLEAFIRVLGRDARREDVLLDGPALFVVLLACAWGGVFAAMAGRSQRPVELIRYRA